MGAPQSSSHQLPSWASLAKTLFSFHRLVSCSLEPSPLNSTPFKVFTSSLGRLYHCPKPRLLPLRTPGILSRPSYGPVASFQKMRCPQNRMWMAPSVSICRVKTSLPFSSPLLSPSDAVHPLLWLLSPHTALSALGG